MSALSEAIMAAGRENVAAMLTADPTWRIFNMLWTVPTDIIPACNAMGWQTVEDAVGWAARVNAATLRRYQAKISAARFIDLNLAETRSGVQALESIGLLAAGRAAQILDAAVTEAERP